MSTKVRIVGKKENVVATDHFSIDECIGNVATKCDVLSLAIVTITEPTSEPWITIDYDEYMYVTDGFIEINLEEDGVKSMTKVVAGQTVFIEKGTRMQVVFPSGNTSYIPVCLPAFKPERCLREEGTESDVSKRLNALHNSDLSRKLSAEEVNAKFDHVTKVYHMCEKKLWDEAVSSGTAYFPPTFLEDGKFTHATAVAERLVSTANHFYTSTKGDWICVELDRNELQKLGILTIFEEAKPVGATSVNDDWEAWVFPHIFGGIPTHVSGVVTNILPMKRDGEGTFLSIEGL